MALRGKKPSNVEKRLKALFYGAAGVGKTTAAIQFPKPYLIDTEKGAENDQYVKILEEKGGAIFQTADAQDMIREIRSLLSEKHPYKTLIIDPLTTVYNDLLDSAAKKVGTDFGRHYNEANKEIKHLLNLLLRLDMNVIITAHSKNEYGDNMAVLGQTYDCYKKLDYLFDLVFEIQKRGKERVGIVRKTRVKGFNDLEQFPFSYESVAAKYGEEILEKDAVPQALASEAQVAELSHLVDILKIPSDIIDKWLTKAEANSFNEMNEEAIGKTIEHLKKQLNVATPQ